MTPPAPTDSPATVDVTAHLPVLCLGLRWLYDTEQPVTAIVRHDGQAAASAVGRTLRFIPRGRAGFATIRVEATGPTTRTDPQTRAELAAFADLLGDLDVRVQHSWVEIPGAGACLALTQPAHATLRSAADRYERGCPIHRQPHWCTCDWYTTGESALVGLSQLAQQTLGWAAATPTLRGPWPTYLDPSGLLSQTATQESGSKTLSPNRNSFLRNALSAGPEDPGTTVITSPHLPS